MEEVYAGESVLVMFILAWLYACEAK